MDFALAFAGLRDLVAVVDPHEGIRLKARECQASGDTGRPLERHHPNRLKDKRDDLMTL